MKKTKEEVKKCPCCGATMRLNSHRLNKGLVNSLIKARQKVLSTRVNKFKAQNLDLSNIEYSNFQKLRYHGLIAKVRKENGSHERGFWLLTRRGNLFCKGLVAIPEKVGTFRNKIRKKSQEMVTLASILENQGLPYWDSIDDIDFEFVDIQDLEEELWDENGQGIIKF